MRSLMFVFLNKKYQDDQMKEDTYMTFNTVVFEQLKGRDLLED